MCARLQGPMVEDPGKHINKQNEMKIMVLLFILDYTHLTLCYKAKEQWQLKEDVIASTHAKVQASVISLALLLK